MGFATSRDCGLVFGEKEGIENVRASAARDGNAVDGVGEIGRVVGELAPDASRLSVAVLVPGVGEGRRFESSFAGGDGALGGGGWDSADSHAARASFSSALSAKGSNSLRTSLGTVFDLVSADDSEVSMILAVIAWSNSDGSGVLSSSLVG